MLTLLKIRNLALVDELIWQPQSGFIGITGETGAGKSVIMGGIELVLGERADKGLIRSGESQCSIEAVFVLKQVKRINLLLEEAGIPACEEGELLIRRVISTTTNRQFVNNSPVTLQVLRQIGAGLVDMHHPDAHRSLTSQDRQRALLDACLSDFFVKQQYQLAYSSWSKSKRAYDELLENEMANARELDYLRHQVEEIELAAFTHDEITELEEHWKRARNAGRLRDIALPMLHLLEGIGADEQHSILGQLRQLVRGAHDLERLDEAMATRLQPLQGSVEELESLADDLRDYLGGMDDDPAALAVLEERMALYENLKRKYGSDFAQIDEHYQQCREKLDAIENREERLEELRCESERLLEVLLKEGEALTAARRASIPQLEADFLTHAQHLGFAQAHFTIELQTLDAPSSEGLEEVEFLFGPNPGEPLKPLRMIASSGEMARVMLALKSTLAKQDDTPLLVFDEIDANVGGEIARAVGMKMRELGADHQVIAITHFPQVAALAEHHYLISKSVEDGRSISRLREVVSDDRVAELMRMLGMTGETARAHAQDLLL